MDSASHTDFPDLEIGLYRPGEERGIVECMRVCFGRDRRVEDRQREGIDLMRRVIQVARDVSPRWDRDDETQIGGAR